MSAKLFGIVDSPLSAFRATCQCCPSALHKIRQLFNPLPVPSLRTRTFFMNGQKYRTTLFTWYFQSPVASVAVQVARISLLFSFLKFTSSIWPIHPPVPFHSDPPSFLPPYQVPVRKDVSLSDMSIAPTGCLHTRRPGQRCRYPQTLASRVASPRCGPIKDFTQNCTGERCNKKDVWYSSSQFEKKTNWIMIWLFNSSFSQIMRTNFKRLFNYNAPQV